MSSSLPAVSTHQRILSGILTALALTAVSGCRESHEEHAAYAPGAQRGYVASDDRWPDLPCLPRSDPRLVALDHDVCAEDYEVIAGPNLVTTESGGTTCNYRITFTTERGVSCTAGRPLLAASGPKTAALVPDAAWGAS